MKSSLKLTGLVAAAHTPFNQDHSLNLAVLEKQAAHFLKNKIKLVFIGGSTGESHSLNVDERRQLAQRWLEVTRGTELKVIVHVGSNCLPDAAALAAHAQKAGALAIAALAPSYFKPKTVADLINCCASIAAAPSLVVVAQTYYHNWHARLDGSGGQGTAFAAGQSCVSGH